MNIWEWLDDAIEQLLDAGNTRLAVLLMEIPTATCDDNHAAVDAMVPEALALARASDNPWLEVFIRHWHLQSRVLHRHQVDGCLKEAVSLYELAHRPENAKCPQSVCTVQDLAATYGDLDGPGYAAERIEVSRENLAKIDPRWPCFDCISGELAEALHDAGRDDEVLELVETQRKAMIAAGSFDNTGNLPRARAEALIALGRFDEALEQLDAYDPEAGGEHAVLHKRIIEAQALFGAGRVDAGRDVFPSVDAVIDTPGLYDGWLDAHEALCARDASANAWHTGEVIRTMGRRLAGNGARYLAARFACSGAELALQRGAREVARLLVDEARAQIPELRAPDAIRARADAVERQLDGEAPELLAGVASWAIARDRLGDDPEVALDFLVAAEKRWPGAPRLIEERAFALLACGFPEQAEAALRDQLAAEPTVDTARAVADIFLDSGKTTELRQLLEPLAIADEPEVRWIIARTLADDGELDACVVALEPIKTMPPAAAMLASIHRERGDLDAALAILDELVARVDQPGPWDWERMVCGSIAGRWDAVRDSASRIGMELPGEGPVDLPGPLCQLLVPLPDGREEPVYCARSGPVTARVLQISGPGVDRERFGDLWVFDAEDLAPQNGGDDGDRVPVFRAIAELERGGYRSFAIEGAHPGDAAIDALRAALAKDGVELQVKSAPDYRVYDGDRDDAEVRGLFAVVALPAGGDVATLSRDLAELTEVWRPPVAWTELASAAGDDALVERHERIEERFDL